MEERERKGFHERFTFSEYQRLLESAEAKIRSYAERALPRALDVAAGSGVTLSPDDIAWDLVSSATWEWHFTADEMDALIHRTASQAIEQVAKDRGDEISVEGTDRRGWPVKVVKPHQV